MYIYSILSIWYRLDHFRDTFFHWVFIGKAIYGESIGKAVRDIMRLSSGLEDVKYVCVYVEFGCVGMEASALQYNLLVQFV